MTPCSFFLRMPAVIADKALTAIVSFVAGGAAIMAVTLSIILMASLAWADIASPGITRKNPELEELRQHWESLNQEIVTADLRYREVLCAWEGFSLSKEAYELGLAHYDLTGDPSAVRELLRTWSAPSMFPNPPWTTGRLKVVASPATRRTVATERIRDDREHSTAILLDEAHVHFQQCQQQLNVWRPGEALFPIYTTEKFRPVPTDILTPNMLTSKTGGQNPVLSHNSATGNLELTTPEVRIEIDAATHLPLRIIHLRSSQPRSETRLLGLKTGADGVTFPVLTVSAIFEDNRVLWVRMLFVEEATFNHDIPESTWEMTLPAETVVVDERAEKRVVRVGRMTSLTAFLQNATTQDVAVQDGPEERSAASLEPREPAAETSTATPGTRPDSNAGPPQSDPAQRSTGAYGPRVRPRNLRWPWTLIGLALLLLGLSLRGMWFSKSPPDRTPPPP